MNEAQHILSGWKDIANYLEKGVRTVQRYERDLGLPVRRPAGRARGSVLATRAELYAWATTDRTTKLRTTLPLAIPVSPPFDLDDFNKKMAQMRNLHFKTKSMTDEMRLTLAQLHATTTRLRLALANLTLTETQFAKTPFPARCGPSLATTVVPNKDNQLQPSVREDTRLLKVS